MLGHENAIMKNYLTDVSPVLLEISLTPLPLARPLVLLNRAVAGKLSEGLLCKILTY